MSYVTRMASFAVVMAFAGAAGVAGAQVQANDSAWELTLAPPVLLAADTSKGLAQTKIDEYGGSLGSSMDQYDLKLTGHAEVGTTFNFDRPPGGSNGPGYVFTDKSDDPTFNQLDLKLQRPIPYSSSAFDMGFTFEMLFGSDVRFTQANGTNFYGPGYANRRTVGFFPPSSFGNVVSGVGFRGQRYPENQLDILQANVQANLPVGRGILLTGGKMVTPFGYETIDPTQSPFYSHSYIFSLSQPQTITGLTASYHFTDQCWGMAGIIVGWDQALEDNNGTPSYILQAGYRSTRDWDFVLSTIFGPEQEDNEDDWRWLLNATAHWHWSAYSFGAEAVVGYESGVSASRRSLPLQGGGFGNFFIFEGDDAWWIGGAVYGGFDLDESKRFVLQGRFEYYNDIDGAFFLDTEIFSATVGLKITPWPNDSIAKNLMIRPEIRWDYADDDLFDGNTRNSQFTIACDAIFRF